MAPTRDELITAARWTITHDRSEGFYSLLVEALDALGVEVNNADFSEG
jgi:hypothetical protein